MVAHNTKNQSLVSGSRTHRGSHRPVDLGTLDVSGGSVLRLLSWLLGEICQLGPVKQSAINSPHEWLIESMAWVAPSLWLPPKKRQNGLNEMTENDNGWAIFAGVINLCWLLPPVTSCQLGVILFSNQTMRLT